MKKFVALAFAAASLMTAPVALVATSSSAFAQQQCLGPDVPEGWLRPGGFCDQLNNKGSVIEQDTDDCRYEIELTSALQRETEATILVAEDCQVHYGPPMAV
jgi:hypothetical protein